MDKQTRRLSPARQNAMTARAVMGLLVAAALSACAPKSADVSASDGLGSTRPAAGPTSQQGTMSDAAMPHATVEQVLGDASATTQPAHHHMTPSTMPATMPMHQHMMPSTMPATMPMHHHMTPSTMPATMPMHQHMTPATMPATMPMHQHMVPSTMPATMQSSAITPAGSGPESAVPATDATTGQTQEQSNARLAADVQTPDKLPADVKPGDVQSAGESTDAATTHASNVPAAEPVAHGSQAGSETDHAALAVTAEGEATSHEGSSEMAEPHLPGVARWAGVMVLVSLGMFLAATVIGPIMRAHQPAEPTDDAHGHDDHHDGGHDTHGGH